MSFDRLAPYYHGLERLFGGSLMQRNRTRHLTAVGHCRNALILGEGTGTFLIALLKAHPHLQVTCVEQSRGMIQQIRRRLATHQLSASQVTLLTQDALAWQAGSKRYDLVVTHFFLDCFRPDQLARLVPAVTAATHAESCWLLTDFSVPREGARWRAWRAQIWLAGLYAFFRITTRLPAHRLTPPDKFLRQAGFELQHRHWDCWGFIQADLWRHRP